MASAELSYSAMTSKSPIMLSATWSTQRGPLETLLVEAVQAAIISDRDPAAAGQAASRALDALQRLRPRDRDVLAVEQVVRELLLGSCGSATVLPFDAVAVDIARDLNTGSARSAGDFAQALERLLVDQVQVLGPDHPDTVRTQDALAKAQGGPR